MWGRSSEGGFTGICRGATGGLLPVNLIYPKFPRTEVSIKGFSNTLAEGANIGRICCCQQPKIFQLYAVRRSWKKNYKF
jgi:hypothetical protein